MDKARNTICNIIIVILSIILFINICKFFGEFVSRSSSYTMDPNNFYYDISGGRYGDMVIDTAENRAKGAEVSEELKSCYAVSDYFQAASYYKAYKENNKQTDADKYLAVMKECRENMEDLTYAADEIDDKLGIVY